MHRIAVAAALAAGPLVSVAFASEEVSRAGEAVVVTRLEPEGDRYEITITPPGNRGVDRRVAEWLKRSDAEAASASDDGAMDLSGYTIQIERVAGASCSLRTTIRSKPTNLSPLAGVTYKSSSATGMTIAAYSVTGDVDVAIFFGTNFTTACSQSIKDGQILDYAACRITSCSNPGGTNNTFTGVVGNQTNQSATYVSVVELIYASP